MAALAGVAGLSLVLCAAPGAHAEDRFVVKRVDLEVLVAGLSHSGCDVEIKPGHPGCRFEKVTQHVNSDGKGRVVIKDLECRTADRDCSFLITVKEPGQANSVVRRGFRLAAPDSDQPSAAPYFTCYVNAPSKIARAEAEKRGTLTEGAGRSRK
jgi:hypothetical protein